MQEVFEQAVKKFSDIYEDALRHTDIVEFLKYIRVQRSLAENHRLSIERDISGYKEGDPSDEHTLDDLCREASDFARVVETFDYVIDLIESGRFAKESI